MRKRAIDRNDAQFGMWYAPCCLHDLYKITDDTELQSAKSDEPPIPSVWLTLDDALADLLPDEAPDEVTSWLEWRKEFYPQDDAYIRERLEQHHAAS